MRGAVGSCPLDQQSRSAGVRPSLPFPSVQTPKGFVCTLGITWPGNRTPEVSRVSAYQGGWGSPTGPSLSRASPDGAEQGMAGLDMVGGMGSGPWKGLMVADRTLPPACRWGVP